MLEEQAMKRFTFVLAVGALAITVHGCASTGPGSRADREVMTPVAFANTGLPGAWEGYFTTTSSIGDSRMIHGDYTFRINDDGTYSGTRISRLVAGTSRGGQNKISGRVVVQGNRVMLDDDAGWRMTLMRKGDTLYGVDADPGTQWPIQIEMKKLPSTAGVPQVAR